jgi:hypothetical protein
VGLATRLHIKELMSVILSHIQQILVNFIKILRDPTLDAGATCGCSHMTLYKRADILSHPNRY